MQLIDFGISCSCIELWSVTICSICPSPTTTTRLTAGRGWTAAVGHRALSRGTFPYTGDGVIVSPKRFVFALIAFEVPLFGSYRGSQGIFDRAKGGVWVCQWRSGRYRCCWRRCVHEGGRCLRFEGCASHGLRFLGPLLVVSHSFEISSDGVSLPSTRWPRPCFDLLGPELVGLKLYRLCYHARLFGHQLILSLLCPGALLSALSLVFGLDTRRACYVVEYGGLRAAPEPGLREEWHTCFSSCAGVALQSTGCGWIL